MLTKKLSKLNRDKDEIKDTLKIAFDVSIQEGFKNYICALDENVGLWSAQLIAKYKSLDPSIKLTCVLPYENYENGWKRESLDEYKKIVDDVDVIYCIAKKNYKDLNKEYLEWLLNNAYRIIEITTVDNIKDRPISTNNNEFYLI